MNDMRSCGVTKSTLVDPSAIWGWIAPDKSEHPQEYLITRSRRNQRIDMRQRIRAIFIFGAYVLTSASASASLAAEFSKVSGVNGKVDEIFVKGEIVKGDDKAFKTLALNTEQAMVVFDSPGGLMAPALEIGRTIRLMGYSTTAIGSRCSSACALAWLAGQPRFLPGDARIGFHSVSKKDSDGKEITSSAGNALVGAYVNSLGLGDQVVSFVTSADPSEITLLTRPVAERIGLQVTNVNELVIARQNFRVALGFTRSPTVNLPEAVRLYRASAEDGFAGSQNNLGDLYERGEGVPANDKYAIYWYSRSAERGEPTAYLSLSSLLPVGTTDKDILMEALKFGLLALKSLPDGKNKATAQSSVEKISGQLAKEDRDRASYLANQWSPLFQEKHTLGDKAD